MRKEIFHKAKQKPEDAKTQPKTHFCFANLKVPESQVHMKVSCALWKYIFHTLQSFYTF